MLKQVGGILTRRTAPMLGLTEQLAGGGSSGAGDSRGGGKARRGSRISLQLATENVIVQNRDDAVVGDGIVDVVKMAQNRMKGATAKEVFQRIDKDGGGELDRRETRRALKELGIEPWSKCRHPEPLLAAPATLDARLGACAAPRVLQARPSRSWCIRQRVSKSPIPLPLTIQASTPTRSSCAT